MAYSNPAVDETAAPHSAHTFGLDSPTLRWANGSQVSDWQFWREHGAAVGEVLRAESPLTLTEIMIASHDYALEYPESGVHAALPEVYVAW
jgi:hypothetical protein